MTDAREIKIPRDALIGMMTDLGILYRAGASENEWFPKLQQAVANLEAAGFRVLGPDEVDPVTVEKCAEEMESLAQFLRDDADKIVAEWTGQDFSDDENRANHQDARERRGRAPIYESAAAAIRALGRKA